MHLNHTVVIVAIALTLFAVAHAVPASVIFTESFENPAAPFDPASGSTPTFDNPATVGGTNNGGGYVLRVADENTNGLAGNTTDGDQFVIYGFGGAIDTSITWEIAAANTLSNGQILVLTYDVVSLFAPATNETWDINFTGGAVGNFSASLSGADTVDVFRTDTFQLAVSDSTQAINMQLVGTRGASGSDDFGFDNISISVIPAPAGLPAGLAMLAVVASRRRCSS